MASEARALQLAAPLLALVACGQLLGLDDYGDQPAGATPSGSSHGGSDGGGGPGAGGVGGQGGECKPEACPGETDCLDAGCDGNDCVLTPLAAGTRCDDGRTQDAKMCDGSGKCVECNGNQDCNGQICSGGLCVPLHCSNMTMDAGETGVDCGGGECAPCPNGQGCNGAADCQSGFCNGGTCAPCSTDGQCPMTEYCNMVGTCQPKQADGAPCAQPKECTSNLCVDGVCCNTPCTAACESCSAALNVAMMNGVCGPEPVSDPEGNCPIDTTNCMSGGCTGFSAGCAPSPVNTTCRPQTGPCDLAEACDGVMASCPPDQSVMDNTPCGTGQVCSSGSCLIAQGQPCLSSPQCAFGLTCADSVCCNSACTGTCQSCALPGNEGFCTPYMQGTDPEVECQAQGLCCNGASNCGMLGCP